MASQKQSALGLHCLSRPFRHAISDQHFRKFTMQVSSLVGAQSGNSGPMDFKTTESSAFLVC